MIQIFTARSIDDMIVFNFLAGRHSNDWTGMFNDILFASFQVLKNSYDGLQSHLRYPQAEIFIRNKLPSILSTISGSSYGSLSSEQAITSSWQQVKSELTNPDLLRRGHDFLHICSLHHLLPAETASELIGDQELVSKLPKGLPMKEDLVSQIHTNHSRIYKLVDELPQAHGSGSQISQAIVETITAYCQNKETHHLRDLANAILKNPDTINALAMFVRPSYWFGPLCTLLDEWRWDEIHGESQPVYEEFGSILLLIIASKRRLVMSVSDMGMQEGFVARYLGQEGVESAALSEEANKHLGEWIYAMYVADALSDEVTTACSPQDFYLLLPNLLRQSMLANQTGKLSLDSMKGGLECEFDHPSRYMTNVDRSARAISAAVTCLCDDVGKTRSSSEKASHADPHEALRERDPSDDTRNDGHGSLVVQVGTRWRFRQGCCSLHRRWHDVPVGVVAVPGASTRTRSSIAICLADTLNQPSDRP